MTRHLESWNDGTALTIRLGDQDFTVTRQLRPVASLKLDPKNQRLSFQIRHQGIAGTDQELHKLIWDMDQVKDLHQSIRQNGGLIEDPIVYEDGIVVEGNCRTVVLRELHKKYPNDPRFAKVYVRVLPKGVTEEQLMMLLGELHIAGKIEWRAFDQAEYVWRMNKIFGKNFDYLASHLRWSRSKLALKIAAYEEAKAYVQRTGDPDGINRFSHFEEFMKKKELRDRRDSDPSFMKQFGDWVKAGKFPDAKDVRDLPDVLVNPEAVKKFLAGGIPEAREVLLAVNPSLGSNLYSSIDAAAAELESISLQELQALQRGDSPRIQKFKRLQAALDGVKQYANLKL